MADEFKEVKLSTSISTSAISTSHICVSACLICGEGVDVTEYEALSGKAVAKVCDKCKEAVLEMRRQMKC